MGVENIVLVFLIFCGSLRDSKGKCEVGKESVYFGLKNDSDRLLLNVRTKVPYQERWWVSANVNYEPSENVNITFIETIDESYNKKGGCAEIESGGIYKDHVKIRFISQFDQGINYRVKIYGKELCSSGQSSFGEVIWEIRHQKVIQLLELIDFEQIRAYS